MLVRSGPVHLAIRAHSPADVAPVDVLATAIIPIDHRGPVVAGVVEVDGAMCRIPPTAWTHALLDQVCHGVTRVWCPGGS